MRLLSRHVLFFCDDCEKLNPAIEAFQRLNRYHKVITCEEENDFLAKIEQYKPELLLIYLHDPKREYVSLLKTVRETERFSFIPLLVYKSLPGVDDLVEAFNRIIKFED